MTEDDLMPLVRRSLGSAIVTGASGASIALSFARPAANDALALAYESAVEARKTALTLGRDNLKAAREASGPTLRGALDAKDQLRRRALANMPPALAGAVDAWRHQLIEGEKLAYFGSRRLASRLEPAREVAWDRSRSVLADAVNAFGEVAEVALATSIKFGEDLQRGDFEPPRPSKGAKPNLKPRARAKKAKKGRR